MRRTDTNRRAKYIKAFGFFFLEKTLFRNHTKRDFGEDENCWNVLIIIYSGEALLKNERDKE